MSNQLDYKTELQKHACVVQWGTSCSDHTLSQIQQDVQNAINSGNKVSRTTLQGFISKRIPGTRFLVTDSIDNSDLNTVLRMLAPKQK